MFDDEWGKKHFFLVYNWSISGFFKLLKLIFPTTRIFYGITYIYYILKWMIQFPLKFFFPVEIDSAQFFSWVTELQTMYRPQLGLFDCVKRTVEKKTARGLGSPSPFPIFSFCAPLSFSFHFIPHYLNSWISKSHLYMFPWKQKYAFLRGKPVRYVTKTSLMSPFDILNQPDEWAVEKISLFHG